jgi:hypothetical protein
MCKSCSAGRDVARTNKAMCAACGWRDGQTCRKGGGEGHTLTAVAVAEGLLCPLGRHTTVAKGGVVTWWWQRWHGVPEPVRAELSVRGVKLRGGQPLPGCGCLVWLKAAAERMGVEQEVAALAGVVMEWWAGVRRGWQMVKMANGQMVK